MISFWNWAKFLELWDCFECFCHFYLKYFVSICLLQFRIMLCNISPFIYHLSFDFPSFAMWFTSSPENSWERESVLLSSDSSDSFFFFFFAPMNWKGDLYDFPWPWISCFILLYIFFILHHQVLCFSKDLLLCSLKSRFPMLSNSKGNVKKKSKWRRRKHSWERQKEVGKSAVDLPRWNSAGLDEPLLSSAEVEKLQR